mmetsp:Transcript_8745/g.21346  ORF Transcript_8745/g.21346 Transcript_8745/m.21346 type:complete len:152 (+) Transcript_8745:819-1274(+)
MPLPNPQTRRDGHGIKRSPNSNPQSPWNCWRIFGTASTAFSRSAGTSAANEDSWLPTAILKTAARDEATTKVTRKHTAATIHSRLEKTLGATKFFHVPSELFTYYEPFLAFINATNTSVLFCRLGHKKPICFASAPFCVVTVTNQFYARTF